MDDEGRDQDEELRRIQDIAVDHAIAEMDEAASRGLDTKADRGDRGFLTGMAAKSLGVAVKIEQFLLLRKERKATGLNDPEEERQAKATLIANARAETRGILERIGAGNKRGD